MRSQSLFVLGAPRSGTTFLCHTLNQHPLIHLTNESRAFVLLKDLIENRTARPDLLDRNTRGAFVAFMRRNTGALIEQFYREELGVTAPIWGDKHPPYADPCVLSGREGAVPCLPRSGSCLQLIDDSLPTAKFLHILRDGMEVAQSLVRKGWTASLADGVSIWRQYVGEISEFLDGIDPRRHLTITYRDLLETPESTALAIGGFLNLPDHAPILDFLLGQHRRPTPFSEPSTDLAVVYRESDMRVPRYRAFAHDAMRQPT